MFRSGKYVSVCRAAGRSVTWLSDHRAKGQREVEDHGDDWNEVVYLRTLMTLRHTRQCREDAKKDTHERPHNPCSCPRVRRLSWQAIERHMGFEITPRMRLVTELEEAIYDHIEANRIVVWRAAQGLLEQDVVTKEGGTVTIRVPPNERAAQFFMTRFGEWQQPKTDERSDDLTPAELAIEVAEYLAYLKDSIAPAPQETPE